MVSDKNEKGLTLIEAAFVMLIFCVVFPISIYYISLTMTMSKAINLGELMYISGSKIEYMIKSGQCVCSSATEECASCLETVLNGMTQSENFSDALKVKISNIKNASGISVLIYPKDITSYTDLDKIYFTLAASKEKAVIVGGTGGGDSIEPISKITPFIRGCYNNSDKKILVGDFNLDYSFYPYPGVYFEVVE